MMGMATMTVLSDLDRIDRSVKADSSVFEGRVSNTDKKARECATEAYRKGESVSLFFS